MYKKEMKKKKQLYEVICANCDENRIKYTSETTKEQMQKKEKDWIYKIFAETLEPFCCKNCMEEYANCEEEEYYD